MSSSAIRFRELLIGGVLDEDASGPAPVPQKRGDDLKKAKLQVLVFGGGYMGQLGLGGGVKKLASPQPLELPECRHVACGAAFSAAVSTDGRVYTWGDGAEGQLGYELSGAGARRAKPRLVEALSGTPVRAVCAGREHALAVTFDGELWAWGNNDHGQLGTGDHRDAVLPQRLEDVAGAAGRVARFHGVAAGDFHCAAVTRRGELFTWGYGAHGQLGHGDGAEPTATASTTAAGAAAVASSSSSAARAELSELAPRQVFALSDAAVRSINCGAATTAAVTRTGLCFLFGATEKLALPGDASADARQFAFTPIEIGFRGARVEEASCGKGHVLLRTADGDVYAAGAGGAGQLGSGRAVDCGRPRLVLKGKRVISIAAGRYHSLAVTAHGAIFSFGMGEHGQLGHGTEQAEVVPRVLGSMLMRAVLRVACGEHHTLCLSTALIEDDGDGSNARLPPDVVVWKVRPA